LKLLLPLLLLLLPSLLPLMPLPLLQLLQPLLLHQPLTLRSNLFFEEKAAVKRLFLVK
jgi:hypothetical protein